MFTKIVSTKADCRVWTLSHDALQPFKVNVHGPKSHPYAFIMYYITTNLLEFLKLKNKN